MARTHILFDKNDRRLMGPIETTGEMYFLIEKLKIHNFNLQCENRGPHKQRR